MERAILLIIVVAIVGTGLIAGGAGLFVGSHDSWTPRDYVAKPGECFVPPQGDPLYDEHYAKNVNQYNCDALKVQSEAKYIDSQTEKTRLDTRVGLFGVLSTLGVVVVIAGLLIFSVRR